MVLKLVSVPPSQRVVMKKELERPASWTTVSCACFFVPTISARPPSAAMFAMKAMASSSIRSVFCRSMMWMPFRCAKMYCFIFGFHRRF